MKLACVMKDVSDIYLLHISFCNNFTTIFAIYKVNMTITGHILWQVYQ
jgi:hypothetical protein